MAKTRQTKNTENLAETLAVGNFTADNQVIKALNGGGILDLRIGADDKVLLTNDSTGAKAYVTLFPSAAQFGFNALSGLYLEATQTELFFRAVALNSYFAASSSNVGLKDILTSGSGFGIVIINNSVDRTQGSVNGENVFINAANGTIKAAKNNIVVIASTGITAKTNNTLYCNKISLQESGNLFDSIIKSGIITADKELITPNKSGEIGLKNQFAELYFQGNIIPTILLLSTPVKVAGTYLSGLLDVNFTQSSGILTYTGIETVILKVTTCISASNPTTGQPEINYSIALNGVPINKSITKRASFMPTASISIQCLVQVSTNDTISNFIENTTNTNNIIVVNINTIIEILN